MPVPIDIPAKVALDGALTVTGGYDSGSIEDTPSLDGPESFEDVVTMIDALPTNNEIVVQASDADGNPVQVGSAATDYVVSGAAFPARSPACSARICRRCPKPGESDGGAARSSRRTTGDVRGADRGDRTVEQGRHFTHHHRQRWDVRGDDRDDTNGQHRLPRVVAG